MTAVARVELRCNSCPAKVITDINPDNDEVIVPSKWSSVSLRGGFGDNFSLSHHHCPPCTDRVIKAIRGS
jgi:hypothetical protein